MSYLPLLGPLFTLIFGTLLHYLYDWSGKNPVVGIFAATNESTWEHLKLLATPMLLVGIAEYFMWGKQLRYFIPAKALSIFLGMTTIIVLFYTYVGIVGQHFLWADIGTFIAGVVVAHLLNAYFMHVAFFSSDISICLGWIGLLFISLGLALFTFFPPHIGLFLDPVSQRYGRYSDSLLK